jgi:hypothetical protein
MILTFGAAMNLLLSVCGLLLTLGVMKMTFRIFRRWDKSDEEERHELENGFYLTFSVVTVLLGIRLFLVPLYFWNMQSFVPLVPGAMCLWGVFNALEQVTWPSLLLKIILPAAYLSWLLLARINSSCRTNPLIRNLMAFFIFLTPFLLIDFGTEIYILSQLTPVEVTCCSSAIDVGTRLVPGAIGAVSGQTFLLLILFPYSLLYVVSLKYSIRNRVAKLNTLVISIPIGVLLAVTITETLTPWLLRLPFHHCPFCLFFQHPLSLVFIVLFWFGLITPWVTLVTRRLGRSNDEAKEAEDRLSKTLTEYAAYAIIIALALILVDILIVFS